MTWDRPVQFIRAITVYVFQCLLEMANKYEEAQGRVDELESALEELGGRLSELVPDWLVEEEAE